ncbi:MucBP domain-containing protein [Enterococcus raffinosus]|uniref:MucBP domain-containing protein n=1 Tax=Enterococcus raffinosus TaxID=71452 RepID=UPI003AC77027
MKKKIVLIFFSILCIGGVKVNAAEIEGNSSVVVEYIDNQSGKNIHPSQTISGKIGSYYDTAGEKYQLTIEGYTIDTSELPENSFGKFSNQKQYVKYYYNPTNTTTRTSTVVNERKQKMDISPKQRELDSWMPDKVLQQVVAERIQVSVDDLTKDIVKNNLIMLIAENVHITSLKGLEYASKMIGIEFLNCGGIPEDLSPLQGCNNLEEFKSQGNNLTEESSLRLQKLPSSVKMLVCEDEKQINPSLFGKFPNLSNVNRLCLRGCGISSTDFLKDYAPTLKEVDLNNNQIADISGILNQPNVERLILHRNKITDISVFKLQSFPHLRELQIGNNSIRDISCLKNLNLAQLDTLGIMNNEIEDISCLSTGTYPIQILGNGNKIKDATPLKNATGIVRFDLQKITEPSVKIPYTKKYVQFNDIKGFDGSYVDLQPTNPEGAGVYDPTNHKIDWNVPSIEPGNLISTWRIKKPNVTYIFAGTITTPYTVEKGKKATVSVKYVDANSGDEIHPAKTLEGIEGESYDVSTDQYKLNLSDEGYMLDEKSLPTNAQGVFSEHTQEVIYHYFKIDPVGYLEVPAHVILHALTDQGVKIVGGKGTVKYRSIENRADQIIEILTDSQVNISTKDHSVGVPVFHSNGTTKVVKGNPLGEVSKENTTYDFYLKSPQSQFKTGKQKYEGTMVFIAKLK